jgi:hypothetical protein
VFDATENPAAYRFEGGGPAWLIVDPRASIWLNDDSNQDKLSGAALESGRDRTSGQLSDQK